MISSPIFCVCHPTRTRIQTGKRLKLQLLRKAEHPPSSPLLVRHVWLEGQTQNLTHFVRTHLQYNCVVEGYTQSIRIIVYTPLTTRSVHFISISFSSIDQLYFQWTRTCSNNHDSHETIDLLEFIRKSIHFFPEINLISRTAHFWKGPMIFLDFKLNRIFPNRVGVILW